MSITAIFGLPHGGELLGDQLRVGLIVNFVLQVLGEHGFVQHLPQDMDICFQMLA